MLSTIGWHRESIGTWRANGAHVGAAFVSDAPPGLLDALAVPLQIGRGLVR